MPLAIAILVNNSRYNNRRTSIRVVSASQYDEKQINFAPKPDTILSVHNFNCNFNMKILLQTIPAIAVKNVSYFEHN
jgi:hypothetical protein